MATNKTTTTHVDVTTYLLEQTTGQKLEDSKTLIALFTELTGYAATMWGPSIIGFGKYHYKYASGHEGEIAIVGFSPRKTAISLYIFSGDEDSQRLVEKLGKFTMGKACIYVKKLTDIDLEILKQLTLNSIAFVKRTYTICD